MLKSFKVRWNIWQLKTHNNDHACVAAAKALGRMGDKRAVKPLIKVLEEMNDYDVWFVHDYFSVYVSIVADTGAEAQELAEKQIVDQGMPWRVFTQANDIIVERK